MNLFEIEIRNKYPELVESDEFVQLILEVIDMERQRENKVPGMPRAAYIIRLNDLQVILRDYIETLNK